MCCCCSEFRRLVQLAFHFLRQHATLILNLLRYPIPSSFSFAFVHCSSVFMLLTSFMVQCECSLMSDAGIPDLGVDAEKTVLKVSLALFDGVARAVLSRFSHLCICLRLCRCAKCFAWTCQTRRQTISF